MAVKPMAGTASTVPATSPLTRSCATSASSGLSQAILRILNFPLSACS